jgi:hypothetical protein
MKTNTVHYTDANGHWHSKTERAKVVTFRARDKVQIVSSPDVTRHRPDEAALRAYRLTKIIKWPSNNIYGRGGLSDAKGGPCGPPPAP